MRIGIGAGPEGRALHQRSYYVFEKDSGAIVGVHLVAGAPRQGAAAERATVLAAIKLPKGKSSRDLGILVDPRIPAGKGELLVDPGKKRLSRKRTGASLRFEP